MNIVHTHWQQALFYCPRCQKTRVLIWAVGVDPIECPVHPTVICIKVSHRGMEQEDGENRSEPTE